MPWLAVTFHDQLDSGTELAIFREPWDPEAVVPEFKLISDRLLPNQRIITLFNDSGIMFQNLLKTRFKLLVHLEIIRHRCGHPTVLSGYYDECPNTAFRGEWRYIVSLQCRSALPNADCSPPLNHPTNFPRTENFNTASETSTSHTIASSKKAILIALLEPVRKSGTPQSETDAGFANQNSLPVHPWSIDF